VTEPYEALADLAEQELAAVRAGDYRAARELGRRATALAGALPDEPPAAAKPALLRAMRARAEIGAAGADAQAAIREALVGTAQRRRAARAYGGLA